MTLGTAKLEEDIDCMLDVDGMVSSRWISNASEITVSLAVSSLSAYKSKHGDKVHAYHVMSGIANVGGSLSYVLSNEEGVEKHKAFFKDEPTVTLYALQKSQPNFDHLQKLQALDVTQTLEAANGGHGSDHLLLNKGGGIKLSTVSILPLGKRPLANVTNTAMSSLALPSRPAAASSTSSSTTSRSNSGLSSAPSAASAAARAKPSAMVSSFFNAKPKQTTAPSKAAYEPSANSQETAMDKASEKASSEQDKKGESLHEKPIGNEKGQEIADNEDEEWDEDGAGHKPVDKAILKQRELEQNESRRRVFMEDEEERQEDDDGDQRSKTKKSRLGKTSKASADLSSVTSEDAASFKPEKRGAMDDFLEDNINKVSAAAAADDSGISGTTSTAHGRKKRLVEKVHCDEKGYLVTEMVWEDIPDDELAASEAAAAPPAAPKSKPQSAFGNAAKGSTSAGGVKKTIMGGTQKSMSSFFAVKK